MKQQQQPLVQDAAQTQVKAKKSARDIFVEIAGGYLLGATIVSFMGLWAIGVSNIGVSSF
jgi:hypothetical protein